MDSMQTQSKIRMQGRIDAKVHDVADLERAVPGWDQLDDEQKLLVVRDSASVKRDEDDLSEFEQEIAETTVQPEAEQTVYNVTTDRFHQYIVDNLDPSQTAAKDNVDASWMALGDDGGSGTATGDTDLNNRLFSKSITDHADNGKDLLASTFLDSNEGNGSTYDEIGLYTNDPANLADNDVFLLNHATFSDISKDSSSTVTFDVTLSFSDV
jgi:hypothetical protein